VKFHDLVAGIRQGRTRANRLD